ncbi:pro-adrenomedullin isoform X1 [Phalacrocorax carbo]|uniref:pro-adrenomedullin isoform X1 n=1 Tax=Phalacrocorax carbo TaxID=9209 RepID=UPI00311A8E98
MPRWLSAAPKLPPPRRALRSDRAGAAEERIWACLGGQLTAGETASPRGSRAGGSGKKGGPAGGRGGERLECVLTPSARGCRREAPEGRRGRSRTGWRLPGQPAPYRQRWSAARQWLLQAHKEGVLAPQETLQVRIATARTFVSVDYLHRQDPSQNETSSRSPALSRLCDLLRGGCCKGGRSDRVQKKMDEMGTKPSQTGREAFGRAPRAGGSRRRAAAHTHPGREGGSPSIASQQPGGCSHPRQALPPER